MQEIKGGGVTTPKGFKAAGVNCGIKKTRKDLALLYSEVYACTAALLTSNRIWAAPLKITSQHLRKKPTHRAVIVNSGNANACTGKQGLGNARTMTQLTADHLKISKEDVLVASTGIIGKPLPIGKIRRGIKELTGILDSGKKGGSSAAEAIMTTDTILKQKAVKFKIQGQEVFIGGMAKGVGMISPNLATMLSFITTDAAITQGALNRTLKNSVNKHFNMITIDGEMSTNDTVIILANGLAGNKTIKTGDKNLKIFQEALDFITFELSRMMVEDGEGATKFVEVSVKNAKNSKDAEKAARSIADSNLVKTALCGQDANWGRIMSALGHAGIALKEEKIDISLSPLPVKGKKIKAGSKQTIVRNGQAAVKVNSKEVKKIMSGKRIRIIIDLKLGKGKAVIWTTDLSEDYIKINACYPT